MQAVAGQLKTLAAGIGDSHEARVSTVSTMSVFPPVFTRFLAILALSFLASLPVRGAVGRLEILFAERSNRPTLVWKGLGEGDHAFEVSEDLRTWKRIFLGRASNGELRFRHEAPSGLGGLYYRGVVSQHAPAKKAAAIPDPRKVAATLVTPRNGGRLTLTNDSGIRFDFSVEPGNVAQPVPVTMTLVGDFREFPGATGLREAVLFQPDGFRFHGAGLLEITFPNAIQPQRMGSFSFDQDGTGFHFMPDQIKANRVGIPITHFSGIGTASWDATARAAAITDIVGSAESALQQALADGLSQIREAEMGGQRSPIDFQELLRTSSLDYIDKAIAPFLEEAKSNCSVASLLIQKLLGIERTFQLLGLQPPYAGFLTSDTVKRWLCNCLDETLQACEKGLSSTRDTLQRIVDMERSVQLLGVSDLSECGFGKVASILETVKTLRCLTPWYGLMTYYEDSSENDKTDVDAQGTYAEWRSAEQLSGDLFVVDAELLEKVDFPGLERERWKILLEGTCFGLYTGGRTEVVGTPCGPHTMQWEDVGTGKSPVEMMIDFTIENGVVQAFQFNVQPLGSAVVTIPYSEYYLDQWPACKGESKGKREEQLIEGVRETRAIAEFSHDEELKEVSANAILGTVTHTDVRRGMSSITWDFQLFRRP